MPKIRIEESIVIKATAEKALSILKDYNQWRSWSPWLILEPEAKVDVKPDGNSYSWEGKRVGSGEMTTTSIDGTKRIDMDLLFFTPWKSKAKVWFTLEENKDETKLTWVMDSSLPFFMFFMKKMMEAYLAMDYRRGLEMLKDYIEDGKVNFKLDFEGQIEYPGCKYLAIKTECRVEDIGIQMEADMNSLYGYLEKNSIKPSEIPFSIYHKMDFVKSKCIYTTGVPVSDVPTNLPSEIISGELPKMKVVSIKHIGPYRHIGNAWSAGAMMLRAKEFKGNKKIHPFELYLNSPKDTEENKLETRICYPVG